MNQIDLELQPEPAYITPITYIYGLVDPDSGMVRYVGKSDEPKVRYLRHIGTQELRADTHKARWLRELLAENKKPVLLVLACVPSLQWQNYERYWIAHLKPLGMLTNTTDGGDGITKGMKHRPESVAKIIKALTGRKLSAESIEKIKQSLKNKTVVTQERRDKLSVAMMRHWQDLTADERAVQVARLRHDWTPEMRSRLSMFHMRKPKQPRSTSQFRGVSWFKRDGCWRAWSKRPDGRQFHLGYYADEITAAIARDRYVLTHHPEAILNFPTS
jgi:hypothetical protein